MTNYAQGTGVSVDKSKAEIERNLMKYGATAFAYAMNEQKAQIVFQMQDKKIRFDLPLPPVSDYERTPGKNRPRKKNQVIQHWEQGRRERWRSLNLIIKAKLEAVSSGVTMFEEEFLSHFVMNNGQTVGQNILPELDEKLLNPGNKPLLLA